MTKAIVVLGVLLPTLATADRIAMKTGRWEMHGDIVMNGQRMPSPKTEHCVTVKDLDTAWWQQLPPGMDCDVDQKVTASRVTWSLDCKLQGGGGMKMTGKIDYTKTTFSGSGKMTMSIPNAGTQTGSMTFAGKYLGACKR